MRLSGLVRKPWGTFAVLCGLLVWVVANQLHAKPGAQPYGCIGSFWASGAAARAGQNPYVQYADTWVPHAFAKNGPAVLDLNLSPPALLPVFSLMSHFPLRIVAPANRVLSLLIMIGVGAWLICLYSPERHQMVWLLIGGAAIGSLAAQQDYIYLFAVAAAAWWLLTEDRDIAAGICLGVLCAIKPNFGLWPVLLALGGRKKPLYSSAVVFCALSLIPVILYGPSVYPEWLHALKVDSHSIFPSDVSFIGNAARLDVRPLGYAISAIVLCAVLILARFGKPTLREASGMAICAAILCSPLAWMHYLLILAPLMLSRRWNVLEQTGAWLLWIIPGFLEPANPYVSHWNIAVRGLPYLVGFSLLTWNFAREPIHNLTGAKARTRELSVEAA